MAKRVKLTGCGLTLFAADVFGSDPDVASVKFCIEDTIRHKIVIIPGTIQASRDEIHSKSNHLRNTLGTLVSNTASVFTVKRVDDIFAAALKKKRREQRVLDK